MILGGMGLLKRSGEKIFLFPPCFQSTERMPKYSAVVRTSVVSIPDAHLGAEVLFCAHPHQLDTSMLVCLTTHSLRFCRAPDNECQS